jgi:hypothetical protein
MKRDDEHAYWCTITYLGPDRSSSLWKIVHKINISSSGMSTKDKKERPRISGLVKTEGHGQLINVLKVLNI